MFFFLIKCLSTQNYNIIDVLSCFFICKVLEHSKYIILYFMVIIFNSVFSTHFFLTILYVLECILLL